MPYIAKAETTTLTKGEYATAAGQRNWLITNLIIDHWLAKPSYATAEEIFEHFFEKPEYNDEVIALTRGSRFARQEWFRSSRMAYIEFARRVLSRYEDYKRKMQSTDDPYIRRGVLWPNEGLTNFGGDYGNAGSQKA